jgi:hypothetical protein
MGPRVGPFKYIQLNVADLVIQMDLTAIFILSPFHFQQSVVSPDDTSLFSGSSLKMTSRLMMILRVAGFHILKDFEFSHYPTKMHLTAFGSNIRLNSSGTCVNAGEPKILRYEMSGLHPFQGSNGVTSLVLEIFQFRS